MKLGDPRISSERGSEHINGQVILIKFRIQFGKKAAYFKVFRKPLGRTFKHVASFISPILFSIFAYILVRTKWRFRATLETMIWLSAAIPGILSSIGLLWAILGTNIGGWRPFVPIYGTIYALVIVVVLQGNSRVLPS